MIWKAVQNNTVKRIGRRWLSAALILISALGFFASRASAAPDTDAQYAAFLAEISSASQDASRWVHTDDPAAPIRTGTVSRPSDADIAELGSSGFIALQEGVTLIQETGGATGIEAQPSMAPGQSVYLLTSYQTGTRSTDLSAGKRVVIAEQDAKGNWQLNSGTVQSLTTDGELTLNAPAQGDQARYIRCFSLQSGTNGNSTVSIPLNVDLDIPGTVGTVFDTGKVKIQGHIELTGDASGDWSLLHWYFWVDMELQFRLVADYFYVDLATEDLGFSKAIVPIEIPIVPGIIGVDLSPCVTIQGDAEGEVSFGMNVMWGIKLRVSYNYDVEDDFYSRLDWPSDGPTFTNTSFAMQAKLFAGLSWGGSLSLLGGLLSLGVSYQDGVLLTADLRGGGFDPDDPDLKTWHACEDMKCISGDVRWQKGPISLELSGFWGIISKTLYDFTDPIISDPFFEFYHSFTYDDGANTTCPHVGYRINVHLTDTLDHPIERAEISVYPLESQFKPVSEGIKTDSSGIAVVYAQRANPTKDTKNDSQLDVEIKASYLDPADPEKKPIPASATATEKGLSAQKELQPKDVYLKMDIRKFYLTFVDPGSGYAQDIPSPLLFFPGRTVHIPDTIPSKSGLHFLGWNTEPDGSGINYAPGTGLNPKGDMTLYARWRVISDVWYVMFNANGGTYAPDTQVGVNGQPMELTAEEARWDNHKFLGWAYEEDAMVPDFPAGYWNLVPYDPVQKMVTLYALWGFDPVSKPIHITYDMNGGPESQKPKDQWIKPKSYMQVSTGIPAWEGKNFLGWSVEKNAGEGEIAPGQYIYFEDDTVLYAIWGFTPVIPIKITYSMNGGPESEKPAPQTANSGAWFYLSRKVPVWDGQHIFRGWKVYPDRTKAQYAAGEAVRFYRDTTLYAVWSRGYRIIEGNGSSWERNSTEGLRIVGDGSFAYFTGVRIDGKEIPSNRYDAYSGSTVIILKAGFLQTLADGAHDIRIVYQDGAADGQFFVRPPSVPQTGDRGNPALWIGLMLLGIAGLAAAAALKLSRKRT